MSKHTPLFFSITIFLGSEQHYKTEYHSNLRLHSLIPLNRGFSNH
uniref:Uncharacterized protein n=1 Tax=Anguilla anguilla TaxID=7936 RepID=A0A0E9UUC8_ANGAN